MEGKLLVGGTMNIRGLPFLCAFALFILGFQFLALALNPMVLATGFHDEVARLASTTPKQSPLVSYMIENRGGGGRGILFSSLMFALLWLPVALWVVLSRFRGWMRYAILGVFLIVVVGFVYDPRAGGFAPVYHATRWGWGLSILMLSLALLRGSVTLKGKLLDIVIFGLLLATLTMLNVIFVVALLPAVALGFYCNKRLKTLALGSALAGILLLVAFSIFGRAAIMGGCAQLGVHNPFAVDTILPTICLFWMPLMVFQSQRKNDALLAILLSLGVLALIVTLPVNAPYWALLFAILLGIQSRGVVVYNRWGWKMKPSLRMLSVVFLLVGFPSLYASVASLVLHALHDPSEFETIGESIGIQN